MKKLMLIILLASVLGTGCDKPLTDEEKFTGKWLVTSRTVQTGMFIQRKYWTVNSSSIIITDTTGSFNDSLGYTLDNNMLTITKPGVSSEPFVIKLLTTENFELTQNNVRATGEKQ